MKQYEIDLNGTWDLRAAGENTVYKATVPGDISHDLFVNGVLPDYSVGMQYKEYDKVVQKDWEYSRTFTLGKEILSCDEIFLECKGIDTFADVYVNGKKAGSTENMFIGYRFPIRKLVKKGENTIRIETHSTLRKMSACKNTKFVSIFNENRIFIRKAQCHFGWDWAPNLPGYGIWQDVSVYGENYDCARDLFFSCKKDGSVRAEATWNFSNYFYKEAAHDTAELCVYADEQCTEQVARVVNPVRGKITVFNFRIGDVRLWWPNGYGEQPFYYAKLRLLRGGEVKDESVHRFAVREVELDQSSYDGRRNRCTIRVNGVPVFCKGSNWVPADCFAGTLREDRYETLLELARRANFTMLRVWGGGYYEKECFYNKCDEKGILIWQDFMFSCCDIPYDSFRFVQTITAESEIVLKRLRAHPCIAVMCGGNELKGTLDPTQETVYGLPFVDYVLRGLSERWLPDTPYVNQSPFGFTEVANDLENGDTHTNCYEESIIGGDMRRYREVLAKNFAAFFSECAVLGPCRYRSLKKFMPKDKIWPLNEVYDDRFVSNPYSPCKMTFARRELFTAEQFFGKVENEREFCHKGMQAHSEIMRCEIEHARAHRDFCGGFMNWMYNDIWPTGTWSVVDYYLLPKSAYYAMADSFSLLHLCFTEEEGGRHLLNLICDLQRTLEGELVFSGKSLGGEIVWQRRERVRVRANSVRSLKLRPAEEKAACDYWSAEFIADTGERVKTLYFPRLWDMQFPGGLSVRTGRENGRFFVDVTAEQFARAVCVDVPREDIRVYYSDNFFDLEKGETRRVWLDTDAALQESDIVVRDFNTVPQD